MTDDRPSVKVPVPVLIGLVSALAAAIAVLGTLLVLNGSEELSPRDGAALSSTSSPTPSTSTAPPSTTEPVEQDLVASTTTLEDVTVATSATSEYVLEEELQRPAAECALELLEAVNDLYVWVDGTMESPAPNWDERYFFDTWCGLAEQDAQRLGSLDFRSALNRVKASQDPMMHNWNYLIAEGLRTRVDLLIQIRAFEEAVLKFTNSLREMGLAF